MYAPVKKKQKNKCDVSHRKWGWCLYVCHAILHTASANFNISILYTNGKQAEAGRQATKYAVKWSLLWSHKECLVVIYNLYIKIYITCLCVCVNVFWAHSTEIEPYKIEWVNEWAADDTFFLILAFLLFSLPFIHSFTLYLFFSFSPLFLIIKIKWCVMNVNSGL